MNGYQILRAIGHGRTLVWNDPDPIEGNDYRIDTIRVGEETSFIHYGNGSEAEVPNDEISVLPWEEDKIKLAINDRSVGIYIDNEDATHIVYWTIEGIEDDASAAFRMANVIDLFHTDKKELLRRIDPFNK